jgi:hypothetical protein
MNHEEVPVIGSSSRHVQTRSSLICLQTLDFFISLFRRITYVLIPAFIITGSWTRLRTMWRSWWRQLSQLIQMRGGGCDGRAMQRRSQRRQWIKGAQKGYGRVDGVSIVQEKEEAWWTAGLGS